MKLGAAEVCIPCARGFHDECYDLASHVDDEQELFYTCCCPEDPGGTLVSTKTGTIGRPRAADDSIGVSAGRKRAAVDHPINEDRDCEWRWKTNCGGGKVPIVGCLNGKQKHRHHGPVKKTSRNETTNVHLICERCHNTWHAKNDPIYSEEEYEKLPHAPQLMTPEDMMKSS